MSMKTICDTNVVLRYILHDDETLYKKAEKIVAMSPYVSMLVLSEVVYVLKSVYKVSKKEISESLITLSKEVKFEEEDVTIKTLEIFEKNNLDFVDCYLLARNQILDEEVVSFDKKLKNRLK